VTITVLHDSGDCFDVWAPAGVTRGALAVSDKMQKVDSLQLQHFYWHKKNH